MENLKDCKVKIIKVEREKTNAVKWYDSLQDENFIVEIVEKVECEERFLRYMRGYCKNRLGYKRPKDVEIWNNTVSHIWRNMVKLKLAKDNYNSLTRQDENHPLDHDKEVVMDWESMAYREMSISSDISNYLENINFGLEKMHTLF